MNEFKARLLKEESLEETEALILIKLFEKLSKLEKEGKNRIWTRVLKNSFAPLFAGKFDYVVGNPPWVNWENLAEEVRPKLKELYREYDILPSNPNAQAKVDISMVFAYRCMDKYLEVNGKFGFLINDAAFKAMAGNGFRKFRIKGLPFKVNVIHDLVTIKPFEGASNRTAMFIATKGEATEFPIPYKIWFELVKEEIAQTLNLEELLKLTKSVSFYAEPLGGYKPYGEVLPLLTLSHRDMFNKLDKIVGRSAYVAHEGPVLIPSGVYRAQLIEKHPTASMIRNLAERDKRFGIMEYSSLIENDLIYPILESGDIKKWFASPSVFAVIPYNTKAKIYSEQQLKIEYPNAFAYLSKFREALTKRSHYRRYGSGKPFYFIHMFSDWMLSNYKVVWNRMGNELAAAVITPIDDPHLGKKPLIPEDVIAFISADSEDEAHYICAILNSSIVNLVLQSIAKGGKNFATPEFINIINIKRYDPSNQLHKKLAELSKKAHQLAQQNQEDELRKVEEEIDKVVAQLYGITDEELKEVKKCLAILEGKETEAEEIEDIPTSEPDITITNPVIPETHPSKLEILLTNRSATPISNVKVKLELPTKTHECMFHKIEKEVKIEMELEGLQRGEHKIRVTVDYAANGESRRIEKTITVYAKSQEEKKPIERAKIDEIFDTR